MISTSDLDRQQLILLPQQLVSTINMTRMVYNDLKVLALIWVLTSMEVMLKNTAV
jgi:hypothetical protein